MTGLFTPGRTATMSEAAGEAAVLLDRVIEAMDGARREGQRIMVEEIAAAIEGGAHLLVQAGTGTGKSIGYLVPLLDHCRRSGERALVSTATLALQRQIITKDAPVVIEAMAGLADWRPRIAVFKGWSNYLCLNRVHGGYPGEGTLFDALDTAEAKGPSALGEEVVRLHEWAKTTDTGDRDDLVPGVTDRAWRQASVSKRECLGRACPMIDDCFAQAARLEAAEADLVVTNHSLFGIHCTGETDILPQFGPVVIDEAHELADRVRDQSTLALSAGMLARIARTLRSRTKIEAEDLERAAEELGAAIAPLPKGLVEERPGTLVEVMLLVDEALRRAASAVSDSHADPADKTLARAAVDEARAFIDAWSKDPDSMILSVSALQGAESDLISISPLDVAPALGLRGFGERGAILTSATLSLGGSFDAMARECGFMMSSAQFKGIDVGTPFDPASQAIMYIARDLPDPGAPGLGEEARDRLVELAEASGGGLLGLFSSWKAAEAGAQALRERTGLKVYMQGDETLSALVDRFREEEDSCLVGTLSLWQGVDVIGPSCRLVVIDRIPFPHREDPVAKARSIDAGRRGFSGFQTVSLTRAALLMAQGAGRLLRSGSDRGVVALLDRRLLTKSYGAFILRSMPKMWPTTDREVVMGALSRLADGAAGK